MSNYYAVTPATPYGEEGLHIGKLSYGWDFVFQAHLPLGLTDAESWRQFLADPAVHIFSESGSEVTAEDFWGWVAESMVNPLSRHGRYWEARNRNGVFDQHVDRWIDPQGHPFSNYEFS